MSELKIYEEICPECNGSGSIKTHEKFWTICPVCEGDGKINWITKIKKCCNLPIGHVVVFTRVQYIKVGKNKWKRIRKEN